MLIYIARRLVWTVAVVVVVLLVTFLVFFKLPAGDPAIRFAGKQPSPENLKVIRHRMGFDKAWYVQFKNFTVKFVTGDEYGWPGFGYDWVNNEPVLPQIEAGTPRTLSVIGGAALLWLTSGVLIGVLSAVKRRSLIDRMSMSFALFGISAPVFWLGLMALWIFWFKWNAWFGWSLIGGTGYVPFSQSPTGWLHHLVGPWCVLALLYAAFYARITRGNLLEALGEDYIRTARAKGLSEAKVIFKHGLRASLTPIVTMFGLDIALLVGGAVITESVFNIGGLGYKTIFAARNQDLPLVIAVVLVASTAVALANLVVDVLYAYLDPRVRYT
jgi:peptide/nickel transport system permease protein